MTTNYDSSTAEGVAVDEDITTVASEKEVPELTKELSHSVFSNSLGKYLRCKSSWGLLMVAYVARLLPDPAGPHFTCAQDGLQILVLRIILKILVYNTTPNSTCTWGTYLVSCKLVYRAYN